jgi:hypothetical protein
MTEHIPCILCIPLNAVSLNTLVLHSLYHWTQCSVHTIERIPCVLCT